MRKFARTAAISAVVAVVVFAILKPAKTPVVAQLTKQHRPRPQMPTITTLPDFPGIPLFPRILTKRKQKELLQDLINNKVHTYPETSARGHRAGKFTSTGIFGSWPPTEAQIARIAPHYDNILFGADKKDLIPRFKKYNPDVTFFIYVDSGLNPGWRQSDAGGVDAKDTQWIVEHHPDWILKDNDGQLIRSRGGLSNPGEYWPDPGNRGWQNYFAEKVLKLLKETGGAWNGVLLDQFIGTADGYERYAKASRQVKYPTDEDFQAAWIEFFKAVRPKLPVPIIVNMEGGSIIRRPAFVEEVAKAAGGVENEIFPEEMPVEDLRPYLETVQNLPPNIHVRINSKPAGWAGDIDRTLFAYYCYLLIAGRNREVYWTNKEGSSDVPHYWYREFDLDLGAAKGNIQFGTTIWSREFENAVVIVNPGKVPGEYSWPSSVSYCDVLATPLTSPIRLRSRTAMLLVRDTSILPMRTP
ncbi:MAG: hypothetical protein HY735_15455 [Verrucomicrobia bacterium]|nr:hypothetical protein [Verrucomicrobiota bacterium]